LSGQLLLFYISLVFSILENILLKYFARVICFCGKSLKKNNLHIYISIAVGWSNPRLVTWLYFRFQLDDFSMRCR